MLADGKAGDLMRFSRLIVRELGKTRRDIGRIGAAHKKAAFTATRVEGYRLSTLLKKDIREGAPGGDRFEPLSMIRQKTARSKKPLRRLAIPIRYRTDATGEDYVVSVGFVDPTRGRKLSKSWKKIAAFQQAGGTRVIPARFQFNTMLDRMTAIRTGAKLGKRSKFRKYFFLKKSTKYWHVPARPIIEPFWDANVNEARRNIQKNHERKLRGERI